MTWVLIVLVLATVAVAAPFWAEARRSPPDPRAATGQLAELSQGRTHYRWIGPVRGPVAVAVHGLIGPSTVCDDLAAGLGATGYRVLVYDLYGRGFSDAPQGRQDAAFFLRQLEDLLADQGLSDDLTLVGHSMGGSIIAAYAERHPEAVRQIVLLAPAGIEVTETRPDRLIRDLRGVGDWLFRIVAPLRMRRDLAAAVAGPRSESLRAQARRRGFYPAVLSSRRHLLFEGQEKAHRTIGRQDVPVVAIWGEEDRVVPLRALGTLAQWNRNARQEVVPGAGHDLPQAHAAAVLDILRGILREV